MPDKGNDVFPPPTSFPLPLLYHTCEVSYFYNKGSRHIRSYQ